jgi:2-keto-4-pentenoate hydratase/2-oxohepta-3-ene-1,7-dioic acid hydratase in catechol pathway
MKLVTYVTQGAAPRAGVLRDNGTVIDMAAAGQASGMSLPSEVIDLLDLGPVGLRDAARAASVGGIPELSGVPLEHVRLLAPLPRPRKILAVAGNYADHLIESRMDVPAKHEMTIRPFMKPPNSVIGPDEPIRFPRWSTTLDYEAELAIVIGRRATAVPADGALSYVAGYAVFNDISARSLTIAANRTPRDRDRFFDWLAGKWFDTFSPLGPFIATAEEIPDPHALALSLSVNGTRRQTASTGQMIFGCDEIVAFFSHLTTLEPGDLIATGTPAGVGTVEKRYLQPGDVIEATIENLGTLRNTVAERE